MKLELLGHSPALGALALLLNDRGWDVSWRRGQSREHFRPIEIPRDLQNRLQKLELRQWIPNLPRPVGLLKGPLRRNSFEWDDIFKKIAHAKGVRVLETNTETPAWPELTQNEAVVLDLDPAETWSWADCFQLEPAEPSEAARFCRTYLCEDIAPQWARPSQNLWIFKRVSFFLERLSPSSCLLHCASVAPPWIDQVLKSLSAPRGPRELSPLRSLWLSCGAPRLVESAHLVPGLQAVELPGVFQLGLSSGRVDTLVEAEASWALRGVLDLERDLLKMGPIPSATQLLQATSKWNARQRTMYRREVFRRRALEFAALYPRASHFFRRILQRAGWRDSPQQSPVLQDHPKA